MILSRLRQLIGIERKPEEKEIKPQPENAEINAIEAEIRQRFTGCFLGLAVGDAKGMPAESGSVENADHVADTFDYIPGYLPAGHFTDDTHNATILAESLVEKGYFDPTDFMDKMTRMDLRRGYGPTTIQAIRNFISFGVDAKIGIDTPDDGPAMRVAPMGLLYHREPDLLAKHVNRQARLTHDNDLAAAGSMTIAFSVAYMINHFNQTFEKQKFLKELKAAIGPLSPELAYTFDENAILPPRECCYVLEAVPHAIRTFISHPYDFQKTVSEAIRGAGDADTIACMAGAISGALNGEDKIPVEWLQKLENGFKGKDYIKNLALEIYKLSKEKAWRNGGDSNPRPPQ